jgi:FixJ family two-component response regulator
VDRLILDIAMPNMSRLELQNELNARKSKIPIVFITARTGGDARARILARERSIVRSSR